MRAPETQSHGGVAPVAKSPAASAAKSGAVGLFLLAASFGPTAAADWYVAPSISQLFEFDDNDSLDPDNRKIVWGFTTRPAIEIEGHTPRTTLSLNSRLEYSNFPDNEELNSFDQFVTAALQHALPRTQLSLNSSIGRTTTRRTEDEDTGRDFSDARRLTLSGGASLSYSATQLASVGLNGSVTRSTADTSALDDFISLTAGPFLSLRTTEKDTVSLSSRYTRFKRTSGSSLKSDAFAGDVTWTHILAEQISVSFRGGANYRTTSQEAGVSGAAVSSDRTSSDFEAGVTVNYSEERGGLSGSFDRSLAPSSNGRLEERSSLRLSANYKVTPLITFDLATVYINQNSADDEDADERDFFSIEPGVGWRFLKDWNFRIGYKLRTQILGSQDRGISSGFRASLTWRAPAWGEKMTK